MNYIRKLSSPEEIEEVSHILYRVYIEKMNWDFTTNNRSNLRIEERNGRKILLDDFTDSAVWFGICHGERIIGCARVQHIDEHGMLEVERYENSSVIRELLPKNRNRTVELNKLAMLPEAATPRTINNLFLELFKYCQRMDVHAITFTNNRFLKKFYDRIGFSIKLANAFKYSDDDPDTVNYYFADHDQLDLLTIINNLELLLKSDARLSGAENILKALEIVAPILPIPVYWHDRSGVVLGINEKCLSGMGATREIIGKLPSDFYPKEIAEHILQHHELVMTTGKILAQEEMINDITTGKPRYFTAIKAPLYDNVGDVIGIVGTSIETTDVKESARLKQENERLAIENQFQNKLIVEQNNFREIINQAVHDIRSPLASLSILSKYMHGLHEEVVSIIAGSTKRINDIANNLLVKYRYDDANNTNRASDKNIFQVSLALQEIISEKKYEFYDYNVIFEVNIPDYGYLTFLNAEEHSFKRMISNIVNNSVEALEEKTGIVAINLDTCDNFIVITVSDNGMGMPPHIVEKIINGIPVTAGKSKGYGIGFTQIRDALSTNNGQLSIQSTVGLGTKVILRFVKPEQPCFVASAITAKSDDIIVVLDDDESIHKAWQMRLRRECPSLQPHCFKNSLDMNNFLTTLSDDERDRVLFLADYELPNQNLNGLEVIEKTKLRRSLLITNRFSSKEIQAKLNVLKIQMVPKPYISQIPLQVS